jgi:hypothetical protein
MAMTEPTRRAETEAQTIPLIHSKPCTATTLPLSYYCSNNSVQRCVRPNPIRIHTEVFVASGVSTLCRATGRARGLLPR